MPQRAAAVLRGADLPLLLSLDVLLEERNVAPLRDFSAVPALVAHTDLVCTVPAAMAPGDDPGLEMAALAFPFSTYTLCMAWHPAAGADPGLSWLRALVETITAGSRPARALQHGH